MLLLFLALLLGGAVLALSQRQAISDWARLRKYQAPAAIADIATKDTMTDYARKVFYVNDPQLSDKTDFRNQCPKNGGEQTIVLGCYRGFQNGIFVLHVTDARLDGVEQVTAAHEMLHAAYDRLSTSERSRINALLTDYYHNDLKDERLKAIVDSYKKTEPNDVVNEMHSIFGTEVVQLPPALEQYYARYFTQRTQVAAFAARYQAEFTSRQAQVTQDDAQLTALKAQIESAQATLETNLSSIEAQRTQLTNLRTNNDIAAYNAGVPAYNAAIVSYNNLVATTKAQIEHYNALVAERNAIALEQNKLSSELNASAAPIQQ